MRTTYRDLASFITTFLNDFIKTYVCRVPREQPQGNGSWPVRHQG